MTDRATTPGLHGRRIAGPPVSHCRRPRALSLTLHQQHRRADPHVDLGSAKDRRSVAGLRRGRRPGRLLDLGSLEVREVLSEFERLIADGLPVAEVPEPEGVSEEVFLTTPANTL